MSSGTTAEVEGGEGIQGRIEEIARSEDPSKARMLTEQLITSCHINKEDETGSSRTIVAALLEKLSTGPSPSIAIITALECLADHGIAVDRIRCDERFMRGTEQLRVVGVSAPELDAVQKGSVAAEETTEATAAPLSSHSVSGKGGDSAEESQSDLGLWETIKEAVMEGDESEDVQSKEDSARSEGPGTMPEAADSTAAVDHETSSGLSGVFYKGLQNLKASVDELAQAVEDDVSDDTSEAEEKKESVGTVGGLLRRGYESVKATATEIAQAVEDDSSDESREESGTVEEAPSSSSAWGFASSSLGYLKTSVAALAASVDSSDDDEEVAEGKAKPEGRDTPADDIRHYYVALQRGRAALAESKRKAYAELKAEVLRKRAIARARKPVAPCAWQNWSDFQKNRPPWTYADAPGFRIGTDALVNSEPSGNFMKNPSRMGIYGAKGVPPPHERRRSKPFMKEFAYSAKGNDGGYFDASIGRLDEPIAGRDDSRPNGDRQKRSSRIAGRGGSEGDFWVVEKTARPPWSTQPFALDYFDREMAKESISSKDELKGLRFAELAIAPDRTHDYSMPDFIA
ncbi:hypothetical protein FOZ62_015942, partial [Perkinsus olseni]